MVNTMWAVDQCQSFIGKDSNPALHELLASARAKDVVQTVEVSVEGNWLKWGLIRLFMPRQRKMLPVEQHARQFLVRQGLDDNIREALGMWNGKVGYVYLLDGQCRIRWAGNGPAREDEKASLVSSLGRLVDEAKGVQRMRVTTQDARPTGVAREEVEKQKQRMAASAS